MTTASLAVSPARRTAEHVDISQEVTDVHQAAYDAQLDGIHVTLFLERDFDYEVAGADLPMDAFCQRVDAEEEVTRELFLNERTAARVRPLIREFALMMKEICF